MENRGTIVENAIVAALELLDELGDRICPVVDIQKSTGPLVVYEKRRMSAERDISGPTGLRSADFNIFILHSTYEKMSNLADSVESALNALPESDYSPLLIEAVIVEQSMPDLYESKVQLFRRTYTATIQYQIKEE